MEIISTKRLILRTPIEADFDTLHEQMLSNPEVMRFVFAGIPLTIERSRKFFSSFDHEATGRKIGVLIEKRNSQIIGFAGLLECHVLGKKDEVRYEIGFALAPTAWGKGFATEIGIAQLKYGFSKIGCTELLAQVAPANKNSIAVIEKIGMTFHSTIQSKERGERRLYIASAKEYLI